MTCFCLVLAAIVGLCTRHRILHCWLAYDTLAPHRYRRHGARV